MNTAKGQETKEKIINICKELFYKHGYIGTSSRMISKESGTNLGLLNYYFDGKTEIGYSIYFDIRNTFNQLLDEAIPNLHGMDRFLYSSALELYLCLGNHNFGRFYIDIIGEDIVHDKIISHIIEIFQNYSTQSPNGSFAKLSAISLSAMKPALVRQALSEKEVDIDHYITYYLEQQLHYFGIDKKESSKYLTTLKKYYVDVAFNFTPIFVKIG